VALAGAVESSYHAARDIIKESLENHGGLNWLENPAPVLIEARGTLYQGAEHQGRSPEDPTSAVFHETWAFDPQTGAVGREYHQQRPDGTAEWIRELYLGDGEQLLVIMDQGFAVRLTGPQFNRSRERNLRRFPPLLLKEVLHQPEALRSIGRYGPFEGVQAQTRRGESLSLFFGRDSANLGWVEYLDDLPTFADSTVSWKFSDYRDVPSVGKVPHSYAILVNKQTFTEMEVVRVSTRAEDVKAFLSLPRDMPEPRTINIDPDQDASASATVEEVAAGVYWLQNLRLGFHLMFVEFDTFVLAIDAPAGYPLLNELPAGDVAPGNSESWLSQRYLEMISETVPGKPVKYLVLTHFHNDHAGGLYAFTEKGIQLLTAGAEKEAIESFLGREHTLCDREPAGADGFLMETVAAKRVISEGDRRVEIIDVGVNPHTDNMLVAWLPQEKILYVADLLTAADNAPDEHHGSMNRHFLAWLDQQGLDPSLILTSHGSGRMAR
jgi:glyoxylase-like metal-dependent hydrolase (beta-lactamase superfamily II)